MQGTGGTDLAWNMDNWDKELKDYLFTSAPLGEHEAGPAEAGSPDLGIGKL
jgi:hypothetical protein